MFVEVAGEKLVGEGLLRNMVKRLVHFSEAI